MDGRVRKISEKHFSLAGAIEREGAVRKPDKKTTRNP